PFCAGPPTLPTALPETVSLTAAPADAPTAPERGWTLTTDPSLPEVAVPSLVEAKAAPARGWTVATEPSLPPPPALPPPWPAGRRRLAVVGAAGALALGVVLVVLFWPSSAADRGQGPSGSNANDARAQAPPPKETAGAKGETPPVKTPDPVAKSPDKPGEAKPTPPIQQPEPRPVVPNPPPPPGVKVLWSCDERAPLTLQITPKLGLKATVRVDSASSYHRLAFAESQGRAAFPEREHGLKLLLDQGSGVYLVIPFGLVQHIASQKKEHLVTLADGSRHPGKVLTVVSSDDKRTFDLASAQSVVVLQGPAPKRTEVRRATVALTVREPGKMAFEVFSAKLSTRGAFGEAFTVKVAGEELQCNLSDFEKITLWKRGDNWHMTLKVPGAEAREGEFFLPNGWWFVAGDAPNGVVVLLRGHTRDGQFSDSPGITIERRLSP
ncbi:MAG: hypothetical protein IT429_15210, partial [Gemmataceae bacterium]|nr:hypothetical protein [Gemmataceae bacterium]